MKYFLPLVLIAICLFGCKKDNLTAPSVVGRWELRQEVGGVANLNETFTVGNGNIYQFNSDNTYMQYKTDTLIAKGTYSIKVNAETVNSVGYNEIFFNGSQTGTVIQVADGTLSLGLDYNDGIATIYAQIQ